MKNLLKFLVVFAIAVVAISAIPTFVQGQNGPIYKDINASVSSLLGTNPLTTEMNFTFSRVAYTNQPPQVLWSASAGYPSESFTQQSGEWLLNNSGYQITDFNSTASSVALTTFSVANYLGANVSYLYNDQRMAFNGSSTSYIYVGETALTGAPTAANSLASSAGAAQNNAYLAITYSSGLYSMTLYYYAQITGGNSQKYDNQTSVALTGSLEPLVFYDFSFNFVPGTGMQVTISNYTGTVINQTTIKSSDLTGNISKVAYVQYGVTGTGASILDYGYIIDHNTYSYAPSAPLAGAIAPEQGIEMNTGFNEVDPNTVNSSTTQSMNSSSFINVNVSEDSFSSVLNSSSSQSLTSSLVNTTQVINSTSNATEATGSQTISTLRATGGNPSIQGTGTLYITSWTASSIQSQLTAFLENYISAQTGYPSNDISIVSYLITQVSFDLNFSAKAMTSMQNYIDSMIPGMLQANNLSLVNTTTGAIMAGAMAGDFYNFYMSAPATPVITSEGILDTATGITYPDLALAGFPSGSYISAGSIVVPGNVQFYGFTASGVPIMGAGWNPFASLSSAGQAVENFFHSGATAISNAVSSAKTTVAKATTAVIKPISSNMRGDMSKFATDVTNAVSHAFPVLGGTIGNVAKAISGTVNKAVSGVSSGLASIKNGVVGAVLTGTNHIRNTVMNIGTTVSNAVNNAKTSIQNAVSSVTNTLGKAVRSAGAVISPLFTSIKNLPTTISSGIKGAETSVSSAISNALKDGRNAIDSVGTTIAKDASGALNATENAFGDMGHSVATSIGTFAGEVVSGASHVVFGMSSSLGKVLIYVVVGAGIIVVVLLVMFFTGHIGKKHKGSSTSSGKVRQ